MFKWQRTLSQPPRSKTQLIQLLEELARSKEISVSLNPTDKKKKWVTSGDILKKKKIPKMFTVISPTIPFYNGIWSRFIFSPWLITWASSKPTMTSLFKHAGQDNILFLKHCTHSLAPTLTPSSQQFNQLHAFYQGGQLLQYWGGVGGVKQYEK